MSITKNKISNRKETEFLRVEGGSKKQKVLLEFFKRGKKRKGKHNLVHTGNIPDSKEGPLRTGGFSENPVENVLKLKALLIMTKVIKDTKCNSWSKIN